MATFRQRRVVEPRRLSPTERERLIDALFAVHCDVFDGVDRASFARYVVDSPAEATWIEVLMGDGEQIVGYFALHRFDRTLDGRTVAVFRAEAGIRRTHRGGGSLGALMLRTLLPYRLAHPLQAVHYLGCLVHPSSYTTFEAIARTLYPHRRGAPPPEIQRMMEALGDAFGLAVVQPDAPLVRRVGWITRDTEVEQAYWRKCMRPAARFFLEHNPGYVRGDGLLTLVPISLPNLMVGLYRFLRRKLARRWGRIRAALQPILPTLRSLSPRQLDEMLSGVEILRGLDAPARQRIAESAHQTVVPPGRYLFRRGDRGDAMHLIADGAAYVVIEAEGDRPEIVLEELQCGDILGEMALLSGEPRTASVRAASSLSLVTVDKATFDRILQAQPTLAAVAWAAFARRRLETYLSHQLHFGHLRHADREAWANQGELTTLGPDAGPHLTTTPWTFVAQGAIELACAGAWLSTDAPVLIRGSARLKATAAGARILQLPPPPTEPEAWPIEVD